MQLAPMRYTKIEGTAVAVVRDVCGGSESGAEGTAPQKARAEVSAQRAGAAAEGGSDQAEQRQQASQIAWCGAFFAGVGWLIMSLFEVATVARAERRARDPAEIERELQRIDETLHNIEGCILQLQGKMLTLGLRLGILAVWLPRQGSRPHPEIESIRLPFLVACAIGFFDQNEASSPRRSSGPADCAGTSKAAGERRSFGQLSRAPCRCRGLERAAARRAGRSNRRERRSAQASQCLQTFPRPRTLGTRAREKTIGPQPAYASRRATAMHGRMQPGAPARQHPCRPGQAS